MSVQNFVKHSNIFCHIIILNNIIHVIPVHVIIVTYYIHLWFLLSVLVLVEGETIVVIILNSYSVQAKFAPIFDLLSEISK